MFEHFIINYGDFYSKFIYIINFVKFLCFCIVSESRFTQFDVSILQVKVLYQFLKKKSSGSY